MTLKTPFCKAAADLAAESLKTAFLPGSWRKAVHPYAGEGHGLAGRLDMRKSARGAWGIVNGRSFGAAQCELFISRLGLLAGVPVAPVFAMNRKSYGPVLSVVPFASIVHSADLGYGRMLEFMKHSASNLPFFLWMGQDMDRAFRNMCMNADDYNSFAEFDFENSDLTRVFETAGVVLPADATQGMRDMLEVKFRHDVVDASFNVTVSDDAIPRPIFRREFAEGLARVQALPADAVDQVLDTVHEARPVTRRQRDAVKAYLEGRAMMLDAHYRSGRFDGYMIGSLPIPSCNLRRDLIEQQTFRFG